MLPREIRQELGARRIQANRETGALEDAGRGNPTGFIILDDMDDGRFRHSDTRAARRLSCCSASSHASIPNRGANEKYLW